ncbi:MAG: glutathione-dependent reductase [Gammaproteobacteria bacterium 39-13]|nr:glutathione S-transferase family protein [Gammaproteobacteria bacterium]OJV86202.1 MAG: glutathione-dependent reductase [Gammaproteobacteria bacterium 39-13]
MGRLVDGQWQDQWYDTTKTKGEFIREQSQFRNWVTADGQPGPTGQGGFTAESGRYHLYVSYACPWAHRTLIFRTLKNLTSHITVDVVHPHMLHSGWMFSPDDPTLQDSLFHANYLYEIYLRIAPKMTGRVTVPILWDKQQNTIVSNESADIIRMFNTAFNGITGNTLDYYPHPLREEIDSTNQFVYDNINNGVYRCGFATTQEAYNNAYDRLFAALDTLEARLQNQPYLIHNVLTEADWRLFTTLIRFDVVYFGHFKCNRQRIRDFPQLWDYLKRLYHMPGIQETVHFDHIKEHYYFSHTTLNPTQIVPKGPLIDLN